MSCKGFERTVLT